MISMAQKSISPKEFLFNGHRKSLLNEQFMKKVLMFLLYCYAITSISSSNYDGSTQ